jgi:Protein of unknown function (DUF1329)
MRDRKISGLYRTGTDEISAERQARRAVLEALPIEEQRRIFEVFYQARKRVEAGDFSQPAIETRVNNGSNQRSASWGPWSLRDVWVIDVRRIPRLTLGYCYGKRIMYVDKKFAHELWSDLYDVNMKLWKVFTIEASSKVINGVGTSSVPWRSRPDFRLRTRASCPSAEWSFASASTWAT